jgi:CDP-diacylglycerol---serine O-phosphatidyltransferase
MSDQDNPATPDSNRREDAPLVDAVLATDALGLIDDHEEVVSEDGKKIRRRGVYLLPNLLTTGAMFAGFYAVIAGMGGDFRSACVAIIVAMFLDGLDGKVARMTNTSSAFGAEYDSLSDMLAFGVAPALICFSWSLSHLGKLGWTAAFIYVACAALRLARFNVQSAGSDKRYFVGLASPSAAGLVVFMVWTFHEYQFESDFLLAVPAALVTVLAGILMVINVPYYSFKDLDRNRVPFVVMVLVIFVIVIIAWDPPTVLWTMAILYAASGPVMAFYQKRKNDRPRMQASEARPEQQAGTSEQDNLPPG